MPYCQECGSYIGPDTHNCGSCGNKLIDVEITSVSQLKTDPESDQGEVRNDALQSLDTSILTGPTVPTQEETIQGPELSEKKPDSSSNTSAFKENPSEFIHQEGISVNPHWNQIDSHLGRGLIKPVAIENCMDGYHFRYDQPPSQINRQGQQDDKPVEFRFSGEFNLSDGADKVDETNEVIEINENEEELSQGLEDATGVVLEKEEPEIAPEQITVPGPEIGTAMEDKNFTEDKKDNENLVQDGEAPVEDISIQEDDLSPEIDAVPENPQDKEVEILWKARRSWYGMPLKEEYRVTADSLVIMDDSGQVLKEIEWGSVSRIELRQNWLSKCLNIGNLELIGVNSNLLFVLEGIDHPERLQKMLVETISPKV